MKTRISLFLSGPALVASIFAASIACAMAQGTAFTYQGQLQNNGALAAGTYNFTFTLFTTNTGGTAVAGPVTNTGVFVTNGLFTVMMDFGSGVWNGATNWLEIGVETNGAGTFTTLAPRQQLTPVPYAITAENLNGAGLSGTYGNQVALTNGANQFAGSFAGSGSSLTGVNAQALNGLNATNFWKTTGNSGTTPGANYLGTLDNQALELHVNGGRILQLQPDTMGGGSPNLIGGSPANLAGTASGAVIGGGGIGGQPNIIGPGTLCAAIGGGFGNTNDSSIGVVAGGVNNTIQTNSPDAVISGGSGNNIGIGDHDSTISGGVNNVIQATATTASIGGGRSNTIQTNTFGAVIGGGRYNTIQPGLGGTVLQDAFIGGGFTNTIQTNSSQAVIGGGFQNTIQVNASQSVIGGGYQNTIQIGSAQAVIVGGFQNTIQTNDFGSVIGGDRYNVIQSGAPDSVIAGGYQNYIDTNSFGSVISGGGDNIIQMSSPNSVVSGGNTNIIQAGGFGSAINGGANNTIQTGAVGSWIGGGNNNVVLPGCVFGSIAAGNSNSAASYAFAAGFLAKATNTSAFVWGDGSVPTGSVTNNSVTMRATNGFSFFTGPGTAGAQLAAGATAWSVISDRNAKKNFAPVNDQAILEKLSQVPVEQWNYKWETDSAVPHIGPMAQDFKAAFYPGTDDKSISTLEFDGVELAAIQGLNRKLNEKDAQIKEQATEIQDLKTRLDKLEQLMTTNPGASK